MKLRSIHQTILEDVKELMLYNVSTHILLYLADEKVIIS